ncbi:hypothetical protein LINPERHAP2_LOCUS25643 [Linum perenne]
MARSRRRTSFRQYRMAPYQLPACDKHISEEFCPTKGSRCLDKKEWEDVTCSVCMECPHNAVLLLCSSHDKGCRPYMCGTSFRYSNCLDQYKKAYTKVISSSGNADSPFSMTESGWHIEKCEVPELACPLCRGQVKGWTVVEPAREYLNDKKRSCMQDDCSFVGTYKELRKHMKVVHPCARPRETDPTLEQKWRRLEGEREHDDVISTIRSTMPGSLVFGDYVIEGNHQDFDSDDEEDSVFETDGAERSGGGGFAGLDRNFMNVFLLLHAFGSSGDEFSRRLRQPERANVHLSEEGGSGAVRRISPVGGLVSSDEEIEHNNSYGGRAEEDDGGISLVSRLRRDGQVLLNRSGRRRRRREVDGGGGGE